MVTIKDIAKMAGVNVSTVSRALSGSSEVGEETTRKIREIADKLGYIPNFSARALVGKNTKLIGVIVPEISSNYYAQIVNHIEGELNKKGYSLIIGATGFKTDKEIQVMEMLISRKVDGIIFAGSINKQLDEQMTDFRKKHSLPVVFLEPIYPTKLYDNILIDQEHGINLAIEHLAALGHKDIGFISEDISTKTRFPCFTSALMKKGLKLNEKFIKTGAERFELGGYLRMKELLIEKERPTAVFAVYDYMAIGALKAAHEEGVRIPGDMSMIGYDNIRESEFLISPLTTVFPPVRTMAEAGTGVLIEKIENKDNKVIKQILLKPELVIRQTTTIM